MSDAANIKNLFSLWKKYGYSTHGNSIFLTNNSWPYRAWLNDTDLPSDDINKTVLDALPQETIFPILSELKGSAYRNHASYYQQLEEKLIFSGWHCQFEQVAMSLTLTDSQPDFTETNDCLNLLNVSTPQEVVKWVEIGSEAFGYLIDEEVISAVMGDPNIELLLGSYQESAVASALLYKTNDVLGVHQIGVKQDMQGKGIARQLMALILSRAYQSGVTLIVLQASEQGTPLYNKLGFSQQFLIKNYMKPKTV